MKQIFYSLIALLLLTACSKDRLKVDVSEIDASIKIRRYDQALFEQNPDQIENHLSELAEEFPLFIPSEYKNPNYKSNEDVAGLISYLLDPVHQELYLKTLEEFKDISELESQINEGFKHYLHHFPDEKIPTVYTYISSLSVKSPIICEDSSVVIGLDCFLGEDYKHYKRTTPPTPQYIRKKFDSKYIPSELMRQYAFEKFGEYLQGESLLDYMISLGKVEYFVNAMYPETEDSIRFAFTPVQMQWCNQKEKALWTFLSQKELLFSTDYHSFKKYVEDQPFISSLERESPGRACIWQGWRIVKEYMDRNKDVSLEALMTEQDLMKIYNQSKYKP